MKVFVTGAGGQLGCEVMNELVRRDHDCIGSDIYSEHPGINDGSLNTSMPYVSLDLTDRDAAMNVISEFDPDAIVHCAAWTAVDTAEDPQNRDAVYDINVNATKYIAEACRSTDCKLMYISTDYVFDGKGVKPWDPDEKDYDPLDYYGESKLGGEKVIAGKLDRFFIVRTSWVFGPKGNNFVKTILKAGRTLEEVRVVNDQIGTPTYTPDLARLLVDMVETEKFGYYHASNEGRDISWYDFTCEIYRQAGLKTEVIPVSTEEYGLNRAERPRNSRLCRIKLSDNGFVPLPLWQDALKRFLTNEEMRFE